MYKLIFGENRYLLNINSAITIPKDPDGSNQIHTPISLYKDGNADET
jgi:hypothetical protein